MRSATVRAMPTLFWDIETRSVVSLETAGEWRYAADPTTDVLCVGYAVDDNNPLIWTPGDPIPEAFTTAAAASSTTATAPMHTPPTTTTSSPTAPTIDRKSVV